MHNRNHKNPDLKVVASPVQALEQERVLLTDVLLGKCSTALSIWTTSRSLVVPRRLVNNSKFARAKKNSRARRWPIVVRDSGGGATPQGDGILNVTYAYVCDRHPSISKGYSEICGPIIRLVNEYGEEASCGYVNGSFCDGQYNVVCRSRKLAGTAQRRSRQRGYASRAVLFAHALILIDHDLVESTRALNEFYRDFDDQGSVDVDAHVNLNDLSGALSIRSINEVAYFLHQQYSEFLSQFC
ncbi:MAG: hypothetical protein CBC09_03940 [Cellvibrionales bacterium TMED49]|nr:hypothetical protein [Porticoccaceae bacterium]OUU38970.1 MAG: hypothetical protein CBC09_03940 [Cellvibrionales bacterium TMED49]|tara:strand:- start:479 stop:1204 length:726 start_codon:yes stop_codon:yes gene_type:complete